MLNTPNNIIKCLLFFDLAHFKKQFRSFFGSNLLSKFTDLYYGSNKSTGKETGKTHLCAVFKIFDNMFCYYLLRPGNFERPKLETPKPYLL